jgi:hypothetical protein
VATADPTPHASATVAHAHAIRSRRGPPLGRRPRPPAGLRRRRAAATDQIEPLRVVANVLIAGWAVVAAVRRAPAGRLAVPAALGAYLLLNAVFVALEGVTNPDQGDAVRWMLFALIAATTVAVLGLSAARTRASARATT